ncbi:cation diffusion facilitator family transporter [Rapidithrix thailandica]|uniref:Cation diffusion facilitator family transporter n=1 Tax=Rapidithrix thailandica TaxID=413964 RepID=A0AAW9RU44_9BACT
MSHTKEHQHHHGCNHSHEHAGAHIHPVTKNLKVAFWLNASFTVIELIGGLFTNSIAILSDAIHDMGDTAAIGSSLWLEKYAQKGRDHTYSYGYKRFSILGALITSLILAVGSAVILMETVPRIWNPEPVSAAGMFGLAILGLLFNGLAVLRLRNSGKSLNNRAVMLHLMEDALGWLAVLVGSSVIYFTHWYWIDPVLSLGIAVFILFNVFKNLKQIFRIFLQSVPSEVNVKTLDSQLRLLQGVKDVHDMHTWSLDGEYHVLSLHLVIDDNLTVQELKRIKKEATRLCKSLNINHPTLSLEFESEKCELEHC